MGPDVLLPDQRDAESPDGPVHGGEDGGDLHGDAGRRVEEHAVGRRRHHQPQQLAIEGGGIKERNFWFEKMLGDIRDHP